MATYRLPLDLTGTLASNRVTQTRTLNMSSKMGDKFIIPADAPFFAEGLEVYKVGTPTPLTRGIDYELIFEYLDIFTITQKPVYGGIKFKDRNISGQVRLVLQVLGGPFLQPVQNTLETIARNKLNVNTGTWGDLVGVPAGFPVLNHPMSSDDFTGFAQIQNTLEEGVALLLAGMGGGSGGNDGSAMAALQAHIRNPTNAHTKAAVGLANVPNYAMSTYEEADLGVNNRFTSPAMVKYLINKYSGLSTIDTINQSITVMQRDVRTLSQGLQENNISVANLEGEVGSLTNQFQNVREEFANVLVYINDLGASIDGIQGVVEDIRAQVQDALQRVGSMETTVNQIKMENENISNELLQINQDLDGLANRTGDLETSFSNLTNDIGKLNRALLYPLRRFVNAGTYNFSVKPGETRTFTLIGSGGAGGVITPVGQIGAIEPRGQNGSDTILWINTDLTNGENSTGQIGLRANGGIGGQTSLQSTAGIEHFGVGGAGGQTSISGLFSVVSNSNGAGGTNGSAAPGPSHPGAVGQLVQGKRYADGGAAPITAGTGGAGAMVVAKFTNNYTFDVEFTAVVGVTARNIPGNNYTAAAPGLFIIELN